MLKRITAWLVPALLMPGLAGAAVALRVNGDEISSDQYTIAMMTTKEMNKGKQADERAMARTVVDQLVSRVILVQAAKAAGIKVEEAAVQASVAKQKQQFGADGFAKMLADSRLTEKDILDMERDKQLVDRFIQQQLAGKATVTDEQARAYYDSHSKSFEHPDQVRVKTVFMRAQEGGAAGQDAAVRARVDAALARIKAGEDFAKVAGEVSEDPAKAHGGDLGWIRSGFFPPEVEGGFFHLPVGQVSGVLRSKLGYHIFKVEERRGPGMSTFDEVREPLRRFMQQKQDQDQVRKFIEERRATAKVEIVDPALKATLEAAPAAGGTALPMAPAHGQKP